ncbi:MAG: alpha/beta hydrolase-fold protein, partial [Planctomycetaceae bacterium]
MSWSRREQSGWAIELFEPSQPRPSAGLLFLPGHSGKTLINNPAWTQSLEQARLRAACPVSGSGWWVEAGERIAGQAPLAWLYEQVVPALRDWWQLDRTAIAVAGVSLGAQGALGLAYRHAREFPVVAAISPAVDFHELHGLGFPLDGWCESIEAARQHTGPLHLNPLSWPTHQLLACDTDDGDWFQSVERLVEKLNSSGIAFTSAFDSHRLGHCWDYFDAVSG